jgi:hypothetical protein
MFPEGMTCSVDLGATSPSRTNKKAKTALRKMPFMGKEQIYHQIFHPAHWLIRILEDDRRLIESGDEDDENHIAKAFAGMNML